jgi:hypothetical protein
LWQIMEDCVSKANAAYSFVERERVAGAGRES